MWPITIDWNDELCSFVIPTLTALSVFVLSVNLFHYFTTDLHVPIRDSKTHSWKRTCDLSKSCHCSMCEGLLIGVDAFYCDSCGVCADIGCLKTADRTQKCKAIASNEKGPMKHHWIKGSLQASSHCDVCEEESGIDSASTDLECCWCHRSVHVICQPKLGEICDFGKFRCMIIPPNSVQLVMNRSRVGQKLRIASVTPPTWSDWTPLIVVANCKSGNKDGGMILSCFRHLLNPSQVVDLSIRPPEAALEWCQLLSPVVPRILVAGGDGTIGWVLSTIHKMNLKPVPSVGIVPLGTGNDLSRILGWGKEYSTSTTGFAILDMVQRADVVPLDRWNVDITPQGPIYLPRAHRSLNMYNYVSIGVDAQVTLAFHKTRESAFYIFSSRVFNKILYLCFGTQQVVERECQGLERRLEVYLDGNKVDLPEIESVVVINIPSWGAGVDLWPMCSVEGDNEQSISDGKLEVVAIYSSFHIAQLQVGLSQPHRLGQASHVKIKLKQKTAMQVDGEPWVQHPAEINVSLVNKASVLKLSSS